jgi:hypothetical protein
MGHARSEMDEETDLGVNRKVEKIRIICIIKLIYQLSSEACV